MNHLNLSIELMPFDMLRSSYYITSNVNTCVSSDGDTFIIPDLSIIFPIEPVLLASPLNGNMILHSHYATRLAPLDPQSTDEDPNIIIICFKSGEDIRYIPDESVINNFLFSRPLNFQFIDDVTKIYDIPKNVDLEIKSMIDESNISKSWKRIAEVLETKHFDEDLYRIFSLRSYQKVIPATLPEHINSLLTLIEFSNLVARQIMAEIDNPSPIDIITKNFCKSKGINYELIQYHESARKYFDRMLPMPLNFISNIDRNKELNDFFLNQATEDEHDRNREVIFPDEQRQKVYMQRIARSEKIKRVLFPDYYRSISLLYAFWNQLEIEHPQLNREILNQNKLNQERDRINTQLYSRDNNPVDERYSALHQCQVCTMLSRMELKRGQNEPAHHCDRPECKKTYGTWLRLLNRKGYNLRNCAD
jgi:hypothetical protein